MITSTRLACLASAMLLIACGGSQPATQTSFGYTADDGPAAWAELNPDWKICATGTAQSPVNIVAGTGDPLAGPAPSWTASPSSIIDTGTGVRIDFESGGTMTLDGTTYTLLQMHPHTPSEHTLDGKAFPFEMHFVHATEDGKLAVIGVFFEEGEAHPALAPLVEQMPSAAGPATALKAPVDPSALLPGDMTARRYDGSLTTPPCGEGVKWTVLTTPLTASAEQIAAFSKRHPNNARPVQPLGDRTLYPTK